MNRFAKTVVLVVSLIWLGLWSGSASAVTYVSITGGPWTTATTWATLRAGTITTSTASATVTGVGTTFTSLAAGRIIYTAAGAAIGTISSITNATTLVLTANAASTNAGIPLYVNGAGTTPAATDTVTVNASHTVTAASLTISATATNNGTLAVSTGLAGTGTLTNGATGTLNIGGTATITTLTATAAGNTVNYSAAGAQTLKVTAYNNLSLSGGGVKTLGTLATIGGNLTLSGTATATTGANLAIAGSLNVGSGTTLTVGAFNIAVTGTTSVAGTLTHNSATGTKTYTGDVTIANGGILSETAAAAIAYGGNVTISSGGTLTEFGTATVSIAGNLQNDGTLTASTGVHTFSGAAKTLGGANAIVIPSVTVTGTYQNNGTLTVATALAGAGALTNGTAGTLNIGGTSATITIAATAAGNTVNYNGAAAQTLKVTAYHHLTLSGGGVKTLGAIATIGGNLSLSGTATATTGANIAVAGSLNVGSGTTLTVGAFNIAVTGTTSVAGTLTHNSTTGTKTYTGDVTITGTLSESVAEPIAYGGNVTINSGGTLTEFGAATMSFAGNLQNDGTLTASTGVHSFSGAAKTLSGASPIAIPSVTVGGSYQNNGILTVATALAGAGTLTNGDGTAGTLNIGGTSAITTLTATAAGNTVNYNGAAQAVSAITYYHLTISGSGIKSLGASTTVAGTLTLTAGTLAVGANTLTLNGPAIAGAGAASNLSTTSSSNLSFGGTATGVTIPGSVTTLNSLTVNNSSGLSLGGAGVTTTLSGTLALGANQLTTGSNTLAISGNCSANSGSGSLTRTTGGYVIGNLQLAFPVTLTSSTCIYHVGDGTGYAPATIAVGATTGGTLAGRVDAGDDPDTIAFVSGIDPAKSANHYWTLTAGSLATTVSYSATFRFCANTGSCAVPAEVDTGANTGNFVVARKLSGSWSTLTTGTQNSYSTQATGITNFGEFAIGEVNRCFTDSFTAADGSSPGVNWSVGFKTGTFGNPVIFGNRLRLTDASAGVATWATLQRPFPAAGNKVTVVFQDFAYGGSTPGADGIAVVLSDASVAPVVGAFGGSLGYAQKSNPGSDCTTPGGCPGFAGGWLGVGLDEFGNYSTNAEGRNGGSPSMVPESVAIRGSGLGVSGYRFLQGTSTLSPAVDGNGAASPPHVYRVIVDNTDGIHAWTSVERDATGGGTTYTTLIGCAPGQTSGCTALDVRDTGYGQSAIPSYLNLSVTGSTGSSTNIHEIDNLSVCTVQGLAAPTLHHIELDHGGTGCTSGPAPVTVKACADAACTTLYMNSVTVNLTNIAGATWSTDPVTFTGGQTTVTLSDATAGSVTLGATATSPATGNATQCFNGATQTCTLTFSVCTFDVIEVGAAAGSNIYTKLASTAFNLAVLSLSGVSQTANAVQLVDASSGTCSTYAVLGSTSTAVPSTFTANQRKTFAFAYANAARNVRVRVTTAGPNYSCSSDNFAIRPQAMTLTSNASQTGSSGTPVFRAGTDGFSLTATVANNAYTGIPKLDSSLVTSAQTYTGTLTSTAFPVATGGISTASGFKYSEVGNINFGTTVGQYPIYDDTFAQVDAIKGDCTSGFSNTLDVNGKYSCQFGSPPTGPFGRFVPDHFTVVGTVANACTAGAFTYMEQPFTLSTDMVQAQNGSNGVTQNYVGSYAPGTVSFGAENADNGTNLSARLSLPSGNWTAGIYILNGTVASFSRPLPTDAVTTWGAFDSLDIGLTVTDSDVSTSPIVSGADMNPGAPGCGPGCVYKKLSGSPLRMRFGRLRLISGQGSELAPYIMQTEVQYWNGAYWRTNTDDSCTPYAAGNFAVSGTTGTAVSTANGINGGYGSLLLTKPTSSGAAAICLDMASTADGCTGSSAANLGYLRGNWGVTTFTRDPGATVLFGGANSNSRGTRGYLYRRENF